MAGTDETIGYWEGFTMYTSNSEARKRAADQLAQSAAGHIVAKVHYEGLVRELERESFELAWEPDMDFQPLTRKQIQANRKQVQDYIRDYNEVFTPFNDVWGDAR